ncbi:ATP-grasp domain-containing protein [Riemerella anatipestifer]|uniref:ATP-grasp domain-containing protein n=1 Tax=Riemerella anatipestifer TaxID=34085 RepID=UPI00069AF0AA|nr:hypothetical protein [Riemerella anatipestifer]
MKLGILTSFSGEHKKYIDACECLGVDYEVVDFLSSDWLMNIKQSDADGFLCTSTCDAIERKAILDERHYTIEQILQRPIYPSFKELYIHENKRNMAAWLEANNYPHVHTRVFTNKKEAIDFLDKANYPLVFKSNLGAGSSKVKIVKNKWYAKYFAFSVFPLTEKIRSLNFGKIYINKFFGLKIFPDFANLQKFYLLVQDFKPIIHEWRIIKIGDSYFGHQKLLKGNFASGSDAVGWEEPPRELLDMTRELCEKGNFRSMAVDIFETKDGKYYINEIQTMFGSYLNSQMYINGKPGRFLWNGMDYEFQEGEFNLFGSRLLRVEDFLRQLKK